MTSFDKGLKGLRDSMGALSLCFFAAACGSAPPAQESAPIKPASRPLAQPAVQQQQAPSGAAITTTTMSAMLADIERQANEHVRTSSNTSRHRIVILDMDELNTQAEQGAISPRQKILNVPLPKQKFLDYLSERGITLEFTDASAAFRATGGNYGPDSASPQALRFTAKDADNRTVKVCIVAPENPNISSRSVMEKLIGKVRPRALQAKMDPGAYMMALRVAWHETWHCIDNEFDDLYESDKKSLGFEHALDIHRTEMFADVAATLTLASKGHPDIVRDMADTRAVYSRWYGPEMMAGGREDYSPKSDSQYYSGVYYYLTPGHDAVRDHINEVGIERVKQYGLADIKRIATDITHRHALGREEARALADYLKHGTVAREQADFLNAYIERTHAAKARIATETNREEPPFVDVVPPEIDEILQETRASEKQAVLTALELAAQNAMRNGQTARQGIYGQMETWRRQLHDSPARETGLERKLYLAGLLLISGYMDQVIAPQMQAQGPKP